MYRRIEKKPAPKPQKTTNPFAECVCTCGAPVPEEPGEPIDVDKAATDLGIYFAING